MVGGGGRWWVLKWISMLSFKSKLNNFFNWADGGSLGGPKGKIPDVLEVSNFVCIYHKIMKWENFVS